MRKFNVGVVGSGFVANKRHIPSFLRLRKKVRLTAVCDLDYNIAENIAKKFGIAKAYSNVSKMLSKEDLDIVDVCTPPQTHRAVAVEAMENGCHVLLEKPMASKLSDCDKMIQVARKHGSKLSIVHNQIFYPPFLKAQELVDKGAIGELTGMRILSLTHRTDYMPAKKHWIHRLPGGVIGETGPHLVYMSLVFLKNVRNVYVFARKSLEYSWVLYDDYRIELDGENITSSIVLSHANDCTASEVDLFGKKGAIKIDLQSMLVLIHKREGLKPTSVAFSSLNFAGQILKGVASNAFRSLLDRPMLGHDIMIEKFVKSVKNNQPVPVSPDEGRETIRVLEMIVNKLNHKHARSANLS